MLFCNLSSNIGKPGFHHLPPSYTVIRCLCARIVVSEWLTGHPCGEQLVHAHSRFICVFSGVDTAHFFLLMNNVSLYGRTVVDPFTCERHLGCDRCLVTVKRANNVCLWVFMLHTCSDLLGKYLEVRLTVGLCSQRTFSSGRHRSGGF